MNVISIGATKQFVLLKNDRNNHHIMYHIKQKNEIFKQVTIDSKRDIKNDVKMFRSDWGGEFLSMKFRKKIVKKRIKHELTTLHLEWNGVEIYNKNVVEKIRCMIHAKRLMEAF
jgi:hypothetical protein